MGAQTDRTEQSPEYLRPVISNKVPRQLNWEWIMFSTNGAETIGQSHAKNEHQSFASYTKIKSNFQVLEGICKNGSDFRMC